MPAGRPTKYDPKYCQEAIEFLSDGYSVEAFAGHIGVDPQTIYNWRDRHPEFFGALKTGQAKAAFWWEQTLRDVAKTGQGNASAAIFGVKNRSAANWRDKTETEHSGDLSIAVVTGVPRDGSDGT